MSQIPVKDADNWFRDADSGSLSCADESTYTKYMRAKKAEEVKKLEFEALQKDVSGLKSEIGEIKSLLITLANKGS
jgi:hypothetical protein|tara:strand:+ start:2339 stop:2566 length:228 start_codon:yes stop_codon:yes gene_type:complete